MSNLNHTNSAIELTLRYKPDLVFIESSAWDGLHHQLVGLAGKAGLTPGIIVVGNRLDIDRYVSSIEQGAVGYIAPPFAYGGLSMIVHSAAIDGHVHPVAMAQAVPARLDS